MTPPLRLIAALILIVCLGYLVFTQLAEEFEGVDPVIEQLQARLATVVPEAAQVRVVEGDKSYTLNKSRIYLCVRDASGQYYHEHILMYVLVHELAHVMCPDVGHTPLFKEINNALLERVIAAGLYNPRTPIPKDYCMH